MSDSNEYILKENYITTILQYAKRVFIVGSITEETADILKKFFSLKNKHLSGRILCDDHDTLVVGNIPICRLEDMHIHGQDVIFITTLSVEDNKKIIFNLSQKGINLQQIIPAGYFMIDILAEYQGFIQPIDYKQIVLPYMASPVC